MPTATTPPGDTEREPLVGAVLDFIAGEDLLRFDELRAALEGEIDQAGSEALVSLTGTQSPQSSQILLY